ncbi:inositol monophosphatase family protein [Candidatus Thorarchaeota archaeon]|nr:MAG: inositol monophosphatase family protein [Candidatus Thorarchaeota archaeon]
MTALKILKDAVSAAKTCVLDNLDQASQYTGDVNPYGDKTLLLDVKAEEEIINVLQSSDISFDILSEEKGLLKTARKPEYLALVDPIDGSANLKRGIPLVSIGISIVPYRDTMSSDDAEISVIESVFTNETYIAIKGEGVTRNSKRVHVAAPIELDNAIISYDTKRTFDSSFVDSSVRTIKSVYDIRRSASNLLDLCWTAAGFLDGMVDVRNLLPIIHLCGTHMVFEAGGYVIGMDENRFTSSLEPDMMMNFVAASNEELARQILNRYLGKSK